MKFVYIVHQFYPEFTTGTEKFLLNTARMMQNQGQKVSILTYSFYDRNKFDRKVKNILMRTYSFRCIPITAFRHKRVPGDIHVSLHDREMEKIARKIFESERPDIVHVGHSMRMHEFVHACGDLGVPYLMTLTDFFLVCPKYILVTSSGDLCSGPDEGRRCRVACPEMNGFDLDGRYKTARRLLEKAEQVISPSLFVAGVFRHVFPDIPVNIIPHGLSYDNIIRNGKVYTKDSPVTFCYAGSLNYHKGVHIVIEAFTRIRAENVRLKIYGSGPDQLYLEKLRQMATADPRVELAGVFSEGEVGYVLSEIDVLVMPSIWYENYPLILHEALACNVPVIATKLGGMAERIVDGRNGFTFSRNKSDELQSIMERISGDPTILNSLRENMEQYAIPTIEQEAYSYQREYAKCINKERDVR